MFSLYKFMVLSLSCLFYGSTQIHSSSNFTKNTTPEMPLAIPQPRLPASYESMEANTTDPYPDIMSKGKKIIPVKEVQESTASANVFNRSSILNYEFSPTTANENYVTIGGDYTSKSNFSGIVESGFRPVLPNSLFVPELNSNKPQFKEFDDQTFKSSLPSKHENFYKPFLNNYPTYGEVVNENLPDITYSKYYEKGHLPYITTFAPPKINPIHRPSFTISKKKKPFTAHHYNAWKTSSYSPDYEFIDGFADQSHLQDEDGYNVYHKAAYIDKTRRKTGLLHILTALIPFGLLLSALPPRVIFINSTNTRPQQNEQKSPHFRDLEKELMQMHNVSDTEYNIVHNMGLEPSNDSSCNKLRICEMALQGTDPSSSFEDYTLWHVLSRSSENTRINLNLQHVYEAVVQKDCSRFTCAEEQALETFPHKGQLHIKDANST